MSTGIIGKKIGMTRVYDKGGRLMPVTVIAANDNTLLQTKTVETDGYSAVQVGFDVQKPQRVSKPQLGHFKKAGSEPKKVIREFRLKAGADASAVNVGVNQFEIGQYVDVSGVSKGKGFMGVMRKHNFDGQGAAHGSKTHRRNGAIGCRSTPGRIWKNQGMPGHMGDRNVTALNLVIQQIREEEGVILVSGPVPGSKGCYVTIRPSIKKVETLRDRLGAPVVRTDGKPVNPAKKGKK